MRGIEKNGHKLYVPVDNTDNNINNSLDPVPEVVSLKSSQSPLSASRRGAPLADDDTMQLDDTKHKVYIYDLDAELSSEAEADDESDTCSTSGKGRLVFLPDIEKHLFSHQNQNHNCRMLIPPSIFANKAGELAGHNIKDMQMVLYRESEPSSLTVPRHQDNVRRAILEARARLREKQQQRDSTSPVIGEGGAGQGPAAAAVGLTNGVNGVSPATINPNTGSAPWPDDADAMDMD